MEALSPGEIEQRLDQLQGWKRTDAKWMEKKYRFPEYLTGIQFVQHIAAYAEDVQHHPFITIEYKLITVRLTTWKAGGLTDLDFKSAAQYDLLYAELQ
jgi:4a-hydroxytetrahydrobiopterin dehydratase